MRRVRRAVEKRQEQAVKTKKSPSGKDFTQAFLKAGYRITSQREAIFDYLASLDGTHPSVRQIHDELKEEDASTSLATVYNTMGALVRLGRSDRRIVLGSRGASGHSPGRELRPAVAGIGILHSHLRFPQPDRRLLLGGRRRGV